MSTKYAPLKRSQVCLELHLVERQLLALGINDKRWGPLQRKRADLFAALQEKDADLLRKWESGFLYVQPEPGTDLALERARKGLKK